MRRKLTILISSAGRRAGMMACFRTDAACLGIGLRVLATDIRPDISPACHLADVAYSVPACTAPNFLQTLLDICCSNAVDLLVPTIDTELEVLSQHKDRFREVGTEIAVSSAEVVRMARDKLETARFFAAAGIPVPRTAALKNGVLQVTNWNWPLILKPTAGSASRGAILLVSPEATYSPKLTEDYVVQEFMQGEEYTVNVFFDCEGRLRCAIPHLRHEVRAGEVSKGMTRHHARLEHIARQLADILPGARGPLCFQAIAMSEDEVGVFEINARFGGGYPLAHAAGARFSQWLLEEAAGMPCGANNDWSEGITMLRYDAAVFC
jgi:carbamoyl-phosphate synthase large subunit